MLQPYVLISGSVFRLLDNIHVFCAVPDQETPSYGLAKAQADSITLVYSWFVSGLVGNHDVKYCYSPCQHDQPVYFSFSG